MTVLVDTPIWSFAYRRRKRSPHEQHAFEAWTHLVRRAEAVLIGAVRQEVLSGVRDARQCNQLRVTLRAFEDLPIDIGEYELAAELCNECKRHGSQGSPTDFLICAVSLRYDVPIFTSDRDYLEYARHIGIRLHDPR